MRTLFLLAASLFAALTMAMPAAAGKPTVETQHFEGNVIDSLLCGFDINTQWSVDITDTTFYDTAGTPIRREWFARATGTYTGPTNLVASYHEAMNSQFDLATGIQTMTGQSRVAAPGVGVIVLTAGRLVQQTAPFEVLFASGQHPFLTSDGWAPLCEYLQGT